MKEEEKRQPKHASNNLCMRIGVGDRNVVNLKELFLENLNQAICIATSPFKLYLGQYWLIRERISLLATMEG